MSGSVVPAGYADLLSELKAQVRAARTRATRIVNTEMLTLSGPSVRRSWIGKPLRAGAHG